MKALVGSALIRRFSGSVYPFESVRGVFVFVLFGALLSTMINSTVGATSFCLLPGDWPLYHRLWVTWWLGDATGTMSSFPSVWMDEAKPSEWKPGRIAEALLLCVLLALVSCIVFVGDSPLKYLTLPILLWVILRFGLFEVSLSIAILSGLAVFGTIRSVGTVSAGTLGNSLLFLQSYICVIAMTASFLSVVVRTQKKTESALRSSKVFADAVIDSVPGAFYVLDTRGRLVRWNRFLEELNECHPRIS